MYSDRFMRTLLFILVTFSSTGKEVTAQKEQGFRPLFDGRTLNGWRVQPQTAADAWSVGDGVIVGTGRRGRCYLEWGNNQNVADFDLRLQYRFEGKGNSGVNIRASRDKTGRRQWKAYHADFGHVGIGRNVLGAWDFHTPGRKEHGVPRGQRLHIDVHDRATYTPLPLDPPLVRKDRGGWNDVRIVAQGNRFDYYLNGTLSATFKEHLPAELRLKSGRIQLQVHDPDMLVQFRAIRIRIFDGRANQLNQSTTATGGSNHP